MYEHNVNIEIYYCVITIHDNFVAVVLTCDNSLAALKVSRRQSYRQNLRLQFPLNFQRVLDKLQCYLNLQKVYESC